MKTLKTILIMILCLSLAACLAACGGTQPTEEPIDGGWSAGEPTELTEEQKALFEKAMESMTGVSYTPVRFLGSQVVAGMNYRFLCQAQGVYPDAPVTWATVEIYEDPDGKAEVTNVVNLSEEEAAQYGVRIEEALPDGGMQIANPFVDCESLEDAQKLAGFTITAPASVEGCPKRMIQAIEKELIQIFYTNGDLSEEDSAVVLLRKAVGSEDVSGDYNEYGNVTQQDIDGKTVTLKGDGDLVKLAVWTDGDYSYSVSVSDGADVETFFALVKGLQ